MRIAQVAPLAEAVPPRLYGGTERAVSWLTEELVRQGHDVTLFASGDSVTSAKLASMVEEGLRLRGVLDHTASTLAMLEHVRRRAHEFDVIHFHIDLFQFPIFRGLHQKCVTTLHGRLDLAELYPFYRMFPEMPLISISDHQREPMPANAKWLSTIHHGIPDDLYPFRKETGTYLAFLGRIAPEKRPDRAIEIARRAGLPLKIAAKVDAQDRDYFRRHIEPLLENPPIEFIGEISDSQKAEFLGNARALLFPVDWPEPFGLVMIEAMASGTPVIGWRRGSVPEVIDEGVTGLVVDSLDDAVAAVERSASIDRRLVRERFEARFTSFRMAKQYLSAYERLVASGTMRPLSGYHVPNTPRSELLRSSDLVPPSAGAPGFPQPENS